MPREDILDIIFSDPKSIRYCIFELTTKEEGQALVHILEEQPPLSNQWLYVTKRDFKEYENKNHKVVRVVNGKDIMSIRIAKNYRLSRRK